MPGITVEPYRAVSLQPTLGRFRIFRLQLAPPPRLFIYGELICHAACYMADWAERAAARVNDAPYHPADPS